MTVRRYRLERLLGVRRVKLQLAARDLARAARRADASAVIATRIGELHQQTAIEPGTAAAYLVKAGAETRAALTVAGENQALRLADAEVRRADIALDVHRQRAAADAVARAIGRVVAVERLV